MDIVYGVQIASMEDKYVQLATESLHVFASSQLEGKYWVNYMPILKYVPAWVPGAEAAKFAARWRPAVEEMVNRPFNEVKRQLQTTVSTLAEGLHIVVPQNAQKVTIWSVDPYTVNDAKFNLEDRK